ncbi:MAG: hypothetical protein ACE15C_20405 [Phycisphaerae bacterium]
MRTSITLFVTAAIAMVLSAAVPAMAQDSAPSAGEAKSAMAGVRLVYVSANFMRDPQVDEAIANVKKAAAAGYNGVLVTDCKFARWNEKVTVDQPKYIENVKKFCAACRELKLQIISSCLDQGADLLSNDPNLAEGMPVIDAPFVARDGQLVPADEDFKIANPTFEQARRENQPDGWNVDEPGKAGFIDKDVKCDGKPSIRYQDIKANVSYSNGRLIQGPIKCKPFRYYHATVKVKTEDFEKPGTFNFTVSGKQGLAHQMFDIKPTQDWKQYDMIFNTLDSTEVNFYVGSWGGTKGKIWIGGLKVEPGGFVNVIRRDGLTFKITSEDGKTVFEEGKDYSKVADPKLGNDKWPGDYDYWHEAPKVTLPAGSRIKDGQKVLASYSHSMNVYGWGIFACMNEPKVMRIATDNLAMIHKVIQPDGYMLPYDELRHQGFDESCQKAGKPMSKVLADNCRACIAAIRKEDPGKAIYAWNDMFDPYHNAGKTGAAYYLVKGIDPWNGSWEGLDKDVIIMNWMSDPAKRKESLKFFADRGHKQILCGYYDAPPENILPWMKDATAVKGVIGVMYTTWANDYSKLEAFSKVVREFKAD